MRAKAFTLIELLVVISIVALLSSIVLAALNSARDKGRLAAGKQFAAEIDHAASDYAAGMWDFDDCSGATAADRTGNSNHATLVGSPAWSTDTPTGKGCSLSLNGTSQYALVPASSALELAGSDVTISVWIKNSTAFSSERMIVEHAVWAATNTYQLTSFNANQLRFFFPNASNPVDYVVNFSDGNWHQVVGVLDSSKQTVSLYYDGAFAAKAANTGAIGSAGPSPTYIGSRAGSSLFFPGQIDSVHIFGKALTAKDIGKLFASEADLHAIARK